MPSLREVHLRHAEVFLTELRSANEFYSDGGAPRKSASYFREQLSVAREFGEREAEGQALDGLGSAYGELHEYAGAESAL
jgi:hypothetical protein